eukprot:c20510_g1_i1.p1 GENE.c20510_g1_i1~~c20510_g1_i1.p1  ORF type:complete len:1811 (+),score=394.21 c20510_g1_i1:90-5522(+)
MQPLVDGASEPDLELVPGSSPGTRWQALSFRKKKDKTLGTNAVWSRGFSNELPDNQQGNATTQRTNKEILPEPVPPPDNTAGCGIVLMNMQNDYFEGAVQPTTLPKDYADKICKLKALRHWDLCMFTMTQHPLCHVSFTTNVPNSIPFTNVNVKGDDLLILPEYCVYGSRGSKIHSEVEVGPHDVFVECGLTHEMDDVDAFHVQTSQGSLAKAYFDHARVRCVIVAGLDIDGEALMAFVDRCALEGMRVVVVSDLVHLTVCPDTTEVLGLCRELRATVVTLAELEGMLRDFIPLSVRFDYRNYDRLLEMAQGDTINMIAFEELLEATTNYVNMAHPRTGLCLVHYLARFNTQAAATMLTNILEMNVTPVSQPSKIEQTTPAMEACKYGSEKTLRVILDTRAQRDRVKLDMEDCYGRTALTYSIRNRSVALTRRLINHHDGGTKLLRHHDSVRRSVLLLAVHFSRENDTEVLDYLWDKFDERDFVNSTGDCARWTYWNYAISRGICTQFERAFRLFVVHDAPKSEYQPVGVLGRIGVTPTPSPIFPHSTFHLNANVGEGDFRHVAPMAELLQRTTSQGQTLLHQAAWQKKLKVLEVLLPAYKKCDLLDTVTPTGFSALDVVADEVDPTHAFALILGGCEPKAKGGQPMLHTAIKGILMGKLSIVRETLLNLNFGVNIDNSLLDLVSRIKYVGACTSTFTTAAVPTLQLAFSCSVCDQSRSTFLCAPCAAKCHKHERGDITFKGLQSFHCHCSADSCMCRRATSNVDNPVQNNSEVPKAKRFRKSTKVTKQDLATALKQFQADGNPPLLITQGSSKREEEDEDQDAQATVDERLMLDVDESVAAPQLGENGRTNSHSRRVKFSRKHTGSERPEPNVVRPITPTEDGVAKLRDLTSAVPLREMLRGVILTAAALRAQRHIVEELVKVVRADLPIDTTLNRPMHVAARMGHAEICLLLKRNGSRPNVVNGRGETALHIAAKYGHKEACQSLAHHSNLVKMDGMGLTPIHHAVRNDRPEVLDLLVSALHTSKISASVDGLFFNHKGGSSRKQSLYGKIARKTSYAVMAKPNYVDTTNILPEVASLPSGESEGHASPLHLAVRYGRVECIKVLLKHGASPLDYDATNFSPFQTGIWEMFVTRNRIEKFEEASVRRVQMSTSSTRLRRKDTRMPVKTASLIQLSRSISNATSAESVAEISQEDEMLSSDANKNLPWHLKTLPIRTAHRLLDVLGSVREVARARERFAYQRFGTWIWLYLAVLVLFLSFTLPRSSNRSEMARSLSELATGTGWDNISRVDGVWDWLEDHGTSMASFLQSPFGNVTFPGVFLAGSVRLRQVRSDLQACQVPEYVNDLEGECVSAWYSPGEELRFDMDWAPQFGSVQFDENNDDVQLARTWRQGPKASSTFLDLGKYGSGGFFVDLDLVTRSAEQHLELFALLQLVDNQNRTWIDHHTRLLCVEATLYNANMNLFSILDLCLEFGSTGNLIPHVSTTTFSLENPPISTFPSVGFKIAATAVLLFFISEIVTALIRQGVRKGLQKIGFWFDFTLLALAFSLLVIDFAISHEAHALEISLQDTDTHFDIHHLFDLLHSETYIAAVMVLLMWLRLIKYSVLLPRFGRVTYAFMNTMRNFEVISYLVFMFSVVLGFIASFRLAFGDAERMSSYIECFNLLMEMMLSNWPEEAFYALPNVMRTVMFVSFMIVVTTVFINLFISVLSEVYPREKMRASVQCNDNLTSLIETDYIIQTHKKLRVTSKDSKLKTLLYSRLLASMSVVLRLFDENWNLDVPKKEFGWEKGRQFFMQDVVQESEVAEAMM